MQTEYRQTTLGSMQPHRTTVRPQVAVDPGNRFTKWIDCQTVRSIPSYVKELADWEEGEHDAQSFEIGFLARKYSQKLRSRSPLASPKLDQQPLQFCPPPLPRLRSWLLRYCQMSRISV
jgi:hypothetical protein